MSKGSQFREKLNSFRGTTGEWESQTNRGMPAFEPRLQGQRMLFKSKRRVFSMRKKNGKGGSVRLGEGGCSGTGK